MRVLCGLNDVVYIIYIYIVYIINQGVFLFSEQSKEVLGNISSAVKERDKLNFYRNSGVCNIVKNYKTDKVICSRHL